MKLNLKRNRLNDESMIRLSKCDGLKFLRVLKLSENTIGTEGIRELVGGDWKYLSDLDLEYNRVSNKGLKILVKG